MRYETRANDPRNRPGYRLMDVPGNMVFEDGRIKATHDDIGAVPGRVQRAGPELDKIRGTRGNDGNS